MIHVIVIAALLALGYWLAWLVLAHAGAIGAAIPKARSYCYRLRHRGRSLR